MSKTSRWTLQSQRRGRLKTLSCALHAIGVIFACPSQSGIARYPTPAKLEGNQLLSALKGRFIPVKRNPAACAFMPVASPGGFSPSGFFNV
jgi:hypothetical protein